MKCAFLDFAGMLAGCSLATPLIGKPTQRRRRKRRCNAADHPTIWNAALQDNAAVRYNYTEACAGGRRPFQNSSGQLWKLSGGQTALGMNALSVPLTRTAQFYIFRCANGSRRGVNFAVS